VLSTRADLLPSPYLQALGRLQDQVEPFPFADVQDVIEQELLLASLIIGAAMLMRIETTFRIFGYPGLAMLFFLVAASGALWPAFTILTSDQAPKRKR
jgi:ubiquinone biosynthesis protein